MDIYITLDQAKQLITDLKLFPNNQLLSSSNDKTTILWDLVTK